MGFADGAKTSKLEVVGTVGQRNTGTTVRFWPDPKFFDSPKFSIPKLKHVLRPRPCCARGSASASSTRVMPRTTRSGSTRTVSRTTSRASSKAADRARRALPRSLPRQGGGGGLGRGLARRGAESSDVLAESYVNLIPTTAGRHARQRLARRPHRRGARVLRVPQSAAARRQAGARGRLGPLQLRALGEDDGARSSPARPRSACPRARPRPSSPASSRTPSRSGSTSTPPKRRADRAARHRERPSAPELGQAGQAQAVTAGPALPGKLADCTSQDPA